MDSNTVLDGIVTNKEAWTAHPELVKTDKDGKAIKDPETKRPVGSVKQDVTIDFTGCTLQEVADFAGQIVIVKYQNGYARKDVAYLKNDDGIIESFTLKVKEFFKGRVARPKQKTIEEMSLEELKEYNKRVQARLAELK